MWRMVCIPAAGPRDNTPGLLLKYFSSLVYILWELLQYKKSFFFRDGIHSNNASIVGLVLVTLFVMGYLENKGTKVIYILKMNIGGGCNHFLTYQPDKSKLTFSKNCTCVKKTVPLLQIFYFYGKKCTFVAKNVLLFFISSIDQFYGLWHGANLWWTT